MLLIYGRTSKQSNPILSSRLQDLAEVTPNSGDAPLPKTRKRKFSYDVVTLRYIYGHVTYTGMLHIRATLRNPIYTATNCVLSYIMSTC